MIFYYLIRSGMWLRLDHEKLRFFLGRTPDPLYPSHVYPLWKSLRLWALLFERRYAAAIATWMSYRIALYDGQRG